MVKITESYYPKRLEKIRNLLGKYEFDCLLIYGAPDDDPAFLPWILGDEVFDSTYLLITKNLVRIFVPQWFTSEARNLFKKIPAEVFGTPEKAVMVPFILPQLKDFKSIGYAGDAPYKELVLLENKSLINVERYLRSIYEIKDETELQILSEINSFTRQYLESLNLSQFVDKTEKEIAKWIMSDMEKTGYKIGHLCIVSGGRLKETTAGFPTDYVLKKDDLVCIDLGLSMQTYYSDITRCYFLGEAKEKYEKFYNLLKSSVLNVSGRLSEGAKSKEIPNILKEEFALAGLPKDSLVLADLGHGIGTGKHEYPEIGFDESALEKGMVFTLEPEAKLQDGTLVRYEDVFYISAKGKVLTI